MTARVRVRASEPPCWTPPSSPSRCSLPPCLGFPFWLPLPLLGFRPEHVAVASSVSLLYQYWIHTETIGTLGPLEWVLNTPSHHRVHHGSNRRYVDRNYGGILIVWDRLFGTFKAERERPVYGLIKPVGSFHPVYVQFHVFLDIARDLRRARSLWQAWRAVVRQPSAA